MGRGRRGSTAHHLERSPYFAGDLVQQGACPVGVGRKRRHFPDARRGDKQTQLGFFHHLIRRQAGERAGAAVGALAGGALANRLAARWPGAAMWLSFWTTLASAPLMIAAFLTDSKLVSLLCVLLSGVTGAVCMGPVYASVQGLADRRTRATLAAVFGMANTLLGQAVGPLLVGAISDMTAGYYGGESLRFSLEIVSLLGFWPALHLYRLASRATPGAAPALVENL